MTDAEIIKALECCTNKGAKSSDCPAFKKVDRSDCKKYFKGAIDLTKRQQAEIERLQKINDSFTDIGKLYSEVKAEAMTEFADRLQFRCIKQDGCLWSSDIGAELKEILEEE